MPRLEWPCFAEFDRFCFALLRTRYGIPLQTISLRTPKPRIPMADLRRWQKGEIGSVSELWRRAVYEALRQSIVASCERTAERLRQEAPRDTAIAA